MKKLSLLLTTIFIITLLFGCSSTENSLFGIEYTHITVPPVVDETEAVTTYVTTAPTVCNTVEQTTEESTEAEELEITTEPTTEQVKVNKDYPFDFEEEEVNSVYTVVADGGVFLRKGPGKKFTIIRSLEDRAKVLILAKATLEGETWGKTSDGWLNLDYAVLGEYIPEEPEYDVPESEPSVPEVTKPKLEFDEYEADYICYVSASDGLALRKGPDTSYDLIRYLTRGTKVSIIAEATVNGTTWGKTFEGWICLDYVFDTMPEPEPTEPESSLKYLGQFKLSAYCACSICCGDWASGYTATGTLATEGRTIAVDPSVIPYGSRVIINGHTYIAEDCGGAINGNRIDVFFASHSAALQFGIQYADVYLDT